MDRFTVRPGEPRTTAVHLDEAGDRLRAVVAAAVETGDIGAPGVDAAAGSLLHRWRGEARRLDDSTTDASRRLLACSTAHESVDASTPRSLGLL